MLDELLKGMQLQMNIHVWKALIGIVQKLIQENEDMYGGDRSLFSVLAGIAMLKIKGRIGVDL